MSARMYATEITSEGEQGYGAPSRDQRNANSGFERAIEYWRRAIECDPNYWAWRALGFWSCLSMWWFT